MADYGRLEGSGNALPGPAWKWIDIDAVKSDTVDLAVPIRAIRANVAGTVTVIALDGTTSVAMNFAAGETRTLMAKRVKSTGTTATTLEGAI